MRNISKSELILTVFYGYQMLWAELLLLSALTRGNIVQYPGSNVRWLVYIYIYVCMYVCP